MSLSEVSKFFNEESLDEIIRNAGGTKHTSYSFGDGFKKGDSYLSTVYRLKVCGINENEGTPIEVNLIVKSMPKNLSRRKLFRSADFFRNEINFYTKVLPAFEKFQATRSPKRPFTEYPKCVLSHCDGVNDFIALENITFLGYISPTRQNYISLEECLLTIRTIARYHAVSLAFKDQIPKDFAKLTDAVEEVYYAEKYRKWYTDFLRVAMNVAKDAVSKTYPNTEYETKTNAFLTEGLYDDMISMVSTKSEYAVIGHGDCWSPNFLTKYDDETKEAVAVKMIDFQLARYSTFAVDFTFYLYSCTSQELREQHYDQILKVYHESACDLIKDLGSHPEQVFPFEGFLNELKNYGRFGCGFGIESLPMSMMDDEEVADLDEIAGDNPVLTDVWKIYPFKEQEKRERIANIFKHAIDCGYIGAN